MPHSFGGLSCSPRHSCRTAGSPLPACDCVLAPLPASSIVLHTPLFLRADVTGDSAPQDASRAAWRVLLAMLCLGDVGLPVCAVPTHLARRTTKYTYLATGR